MAYKCTIKTAEVNITRPPCKPVPPKNSTPEERKALSSCSGLTVSFCHPLLAKTNILPVVEAEMLTESSSRIMKKAKKEG